MGKRGVSVFLARTRVRGVLLAADCGGAFVYRGVGLVKAMCEVRGAMNNA